MNTNASSALAMLDSALSHAFTARSVLDSNSLIAATLSRSSLLLYSLANNLVLSLSFAHQLFPIMAPVSFFFSVSFSWSWNLFSSNKDTLNFQLLDILKIRLI